MIYPDAVVRQPAVDVALLPRLLHAVAENGSLRRDTLFQPVLHGGRGLSGQGKGNPAAAEHVVGRVQEGQHPAIAQVIHRLIDALLHHDRRHAVFHRPGQNFLVGIHTAAADQGRQNGKIPVSPGSCWPSSFTTLSKAKCSNRSANSGPVFFQSIANTSFLLLL